MERALNLDALRLALGEGGLLPTAEELQEQLAQAEIELLLGRGEISDELLAAGWYLHAVGSARAGLDLYPVDRQLRASQTAGHIFDLALSGGSLGGHEQLELTFAGQVSFLRGGLNPNSMALYGRLETAAPRFQDDPGLVALDVGTSVLALDRARLFPRLEELRRQATAVREAVASSDLIETPFGASARVVEACRELLIYLTYGDVQRLQTALSLLDDALQRAVLSEADYDSRWVAAHLRDLGADLGGSSVWALLPPSVPPAAARAMTLGDPPVLSLWPPQHDLLQMDPSPLDPDVKRLLLSFPTSAGKTLVAQFIAAAHVAAGQGSVCVVVPTHSLAREVRRDIDRRLRVIARAAQDVGPLGLPLPEPASVDVMTPEKLSAHVRNEPNALLDRYSMFIVDEAHLVGDSERGWTLESVLGFLNDVTASSHHRIVLLSAALGNRVHVASWLGTGDAPAATFHHSWKGPRRAHAVLGTSADWDNARDQPASGKTRLNRRIVPLFGDIRVRTGPENFSRLTTTQSIGDLVLVQRNGSWRRDKAPPAYQVRARIAEFVAQHGPVLIIEATKQAAQRTAEFLADLVDEDSPASGALVALASTRVGSGHPLVTVLRKGVGFHHSGLPDDVQAELEDGLRRGALSYLVATTTLVEGINFPVRTVIIGERSYRTKEGMVTTLDAPKLLNAIGRAGRAGRETEGWVVMSIQQSFSADTFDPLLAQDEDLAAVSCLAAEGGLAALAEFEELIRAGEDVVMSAAGSVAADFLAHTWFIATALDELGRAAEDAPRLAIESTLAWEQMTEEDRTRWRELADLAYRSYEATDERVRRRWATSGMTISSAATLEALAEEVQTLLPSVSDRQAAFAAFDLVLGADRMDRVLALGDNRFRGFKPARTAPSDVRLSVDLRKLARDWLAGVDLSELADSHLEAVADETYRYEQLSEFVSGVLEHLLPWVLSTVLGWVNQDLTSDDRLCPSLPAFVRHGVSSDSALALKLGGVRSRRLAQMVAATFDGANSEVPLAEWLQEMSLDDWRERFDAAPSEVADLLIYSRAQDAQVTSAALSGEVVEIPFAANDATSPGSAELVFGGGPPPQPVLLLRDGESIGGIRPAHLEDVSRLLATGVPIAAEVVDADTLQIRVLDPTQLGSWSEG